MRHKNKAKTAGETENRQADSKYDMLSMLGGLQEGCPIFVVRQKNKNVKIVDFGKSCDTILLYCNIPTHDNSTVGYHQTTVGCGNTGIQVTDWIEKGAVSA